MKRQLSLYLMILVLSLGLLAACSPQQPSTGDPAAQNTGGAAAGQDKKGQDEAEQPDSNQAAKPQATATIQQASIGPGSFNLENSSIGLGNLTSYRQTLALGFDGTVGGQETHTKTTMRRTVTTQPAGQITWVDIDGQQQMFATLEGIAYTQSGVDGPCSAATAGDGAASAAAFQLQTLPILRGAESAGEETINNIPSQYYTFDERALGQADWVKAQGEIWVAKDGGYVVKYTLRIEAEADRLGPGVVGVQTWTYELTDPDAVAALDLPAACASSQTAVTIPTPPEAQDIVRLPGFIEFTSSLNADQAIQFYQDQAAAIGWQSVEITQVEGADRMLNFQTADGLFINIRIQPQEQGTQVTIQSITKQQE